MIDCILKCPFKERVSLLKSVTYCEKNIATTVVGMSLTDLNTKLQNIQKTYESCLHMAELRTCFERWN